VAHAEGRVWGGLTAQERAARRRAQFLQAGLELFAARGWATVTVLEICRGAKLSQRYFYEQFAGREALFLAIVDDIAAEVDQAVRRAAVAEGQTPEERAAGVLEALADVLASDPRKVRVALVESLATEEFRAHRAELLATFTALASRLMTALREDGAPPADPRDLELSAFVISGGVVETLIRAVTGEMPWTRAELVAHLTRLYRAAARLEPSTGVSGPPTPARASRRTRPRPRARRG
jgi:AcrR family transcriptional regulator